MCVYHVEWAIQIPHNIQNWRSEFFKWLGRDRLGIVACTDAKKTQIKMFIASYVSWFCTSTFSRNVFPRQTQQVLIIGYERLRTVM